MLYSIYVGAGNLEISEFLAIPRPPGNYIEKRENYYIQKVRCRYFMRTVHLSRLQVARYGLCASKAMINVSLIRR